MIEEQTEHLLCANENLLVEVQERARVVMAFRPALNEVRNRKEPLLSIINAVCDALVVVNDQWKLQDVNQSAEAMFGATSYE